MKDHYFVRDLLEMLGSGTVGIDLNRRAIEAIKQLQAELLIAKRRSSNTLGVKLLEALESAIIEREPKVARWQLTKECVAMVVNVNARSGHVITNYGDPEDVGPPTVTVDVRLTVSDPPDGYEMRPEASDHG